MAKRGLPSMDEFARNELMIERY